MNTFKSAIRLLLLLACMLAGLDVAFSQVTESQARDMLIQRGIPEDTLRARLLKKGYDPDAITPDQLGSFQSVVMETITEIEKSREQASPKKDSEPASIPEKRDTHSMVVKPVEQKPVEMKQDSGKSKTLPLYGQDIFRNKTLAGYQMSDEVAVTGSYILGPGDRLAIIAFGRSQFDKTVEISSDGFIQPDPRLPRIFLKGVSLATARDLLYNRLSQYFSMSKSEFQVTLLKPRNISVHVYGEVQTPGAYSLPGTQSALNVISAAGGTTQTGSLRQIRIIRGNETIPVDVYTFMNDPKAVNDYFLQHNDIIHVPVARKVVSIIGAVTRPMSYELLEAENLSHLIQYAGGAAANAYLSSIQVTRYAQDRKLVTNVNLRELMASGGDYILMNGDVVEVKSVEERTDNVVQINGAVDFPGEYERRDGMRVSELLRQGILRPEARLDFAYLLRRQPDLTYKYERIHIGQILEQPGGPADPVLADGDEVVIMALSTYAVNTFFSVTGAVNKPDTFAFNPEGSLRIEDAILLAGGPQVDAADIGYVIREDPKEPKTAGYIYFNLLEVMQNPNSPANVEIMAGDQVRLFHKHERRDSLTVSVFGAVRQPGKIPYGAGMRLADVISLAGGFTLEADYNRIDIARVDFGKGMALRVSQYTTSLPVDFEMRNRDDQSMQLMPFDHIYVRNIPGFELQQTISVLGEVMYPGTYPLVKDKERIYDLIVRAGGLTGQAFPAGAKLYRHGDSTGLVVIDLEEILKNQSTPSNIVLIDGDVIQIPKSRELVTIEGHVNLDDAYSSSFLSGVKSISVAFRGDKSARYYVDEFAAGVSPNGSPKEIKVRYADGRVQRTKNFLFIKSYPRVQKGATISVGAKQIKAPKEKVEKKTDWSSIWRDTLAQATAVLTVLILVDQLSK